MPSFHRLYSIDEKLAFLSQVEQIAYSARLSDHMLPLCGDLMKQPYIAPASVHCLIKETALDEPLKQELLAYFIKAYSLTLENLNERNVQEQLAQKRKLRGEFVINDIETYKIFIAQVEKRKAALIDQQEQERSQYPTLLPDDHRIFAKDFNGALHYIKQQAEARQGHLYSTDIAGTVKQAYFHPLIMKMGEGGHEKEARRMENIQDIIVQTMEESMIQACGMASVLKPFLSPNNALPGKGRG